jgi:hypothetical protein
MPKLYKEFPVYPDLTTSKITNSLGALVNFEDWSEEYQDKFTELFGTSVTSTLSTKWLLTWHTYTKSSKLYQLVYKACPQPKLVRFPRLDFYWNLCSENQPLVIQFPIFLPIE